MMNNDVQRETLVSMAKKAKRTSRISETALEDYDDMPEELHDLKSVISRQVLQFEKESSGIRHHLIKFCREMPDILDL